MNKILLIADFDGTLARIRLDPAKVKLSKKTTMALAKLIKRNVRVIILSSRPKAFLSRHLPLGIKIIGLRGNSVNDKAIRQKAKKIRKSVFKLVQTIPQARINATQCGVEVHFRGLRLNKQKLKERLLRAIGHLRVRIISGRKVFEIIPVEFSDKRRTVRKLIAGWNGEVIFFGDDESDAEAALEVLSVRYGQAYLRKTTERQSTPRGAKLFCTIADANNIIEKICRAKNSIKNQNAHMPRTDSAFPRKRQYPKRELRLDKVVLAS